MSRYRRRLWPSAIKQKGHPVAGMPFCSEQPGHEQEDRDPPRMQGASELKPIAEAIARLAGLDREEGAHGISVAIVCVGTLFAAATTHLAIVLRVRSSKEPTTRAAVSLSA